MQRERIGLGGRPAAQQQLRLMPAAMITAAAAPASGPTSPATGGSAGRRWPPGRMIEEWVMAGWLVIGPAGLASCLAMAVVPAIHRWRHAEVSSDLTRLA